MRASKRKSTQSHGLRGVARYNRPLSSGTTMSDPREVLESWKEIAAYLGRSVRAVQLWEKEENLPVHRHQHDKQGSVFAYREEIDRWREARSAPRPAVTPRVALPSKLAVVILASAVILTVFGALWKHGVMIRSIAVLPFTSTAGGDIEHVSDGLTELLIDELAALPDLRVMARSYGRSATTLRPPSFRPSNSASLRISPRSSA